MIMESVQGYLEIGIVFHVGLKSFLDDERARSFSFFSDAVQSIGKRFGESD